MNFDKLRAFMDMLSEKPLQFMLTEKTCFPTLPDFRILKAALR